MNAFSRRITGRITGRNTGRNTHPGPSLYDGRSGGSRKSSSFKKYK